MSSPLKVVAIVGPTSSGKSEWALKLAKQFNGIIISADSRQIYKGLDVATAKVGTKERAQVPHLLLDMVDPGQPFSVADYQKQVYKILAEIRKQNTKTAKPVLPILVGGTGLYIEAITEGLDLSVAPDLVLRKQLEAKPLVTLVSELLELDPETIVDLKNKVRVVRAIEIAKSGHKPGKTPPNLDILRIGLEMPREELYRRINNRVAGLPLKQFVPEVLNHPEQLSLYAPAVKAYEDKKINKAELLEKLAQMDRNYARRQMAWLRRDKKIVWLDSFAKAKLAVSRFIESL